MVADNVLDEEDYERGGTNDGHLITAAKARGLAQHLEARLARGLKDDGAVREALRVDQFQREDVERAFDEFSRRSAHAKAEGRDLTEEEAAEASLKARGREQLPPLPNRWRSPEEAARELRSFEEALVKFTEFCRRCGAADGFRVW
jgi:hypothetical protein